MNQNYNLNALFDLAKKGSKNELLSKLSKEDAQKVKNVLEDKELTKKLLESEQVKNIMKSLMKDGKNNG